MEGWSKIFDEPRSARPVAWSAGLCINLVLLGAIHQLTAQPARPTGSDTRTHLVEFIRLQPSPMHRPERDRVLPPPTPSQPLPPPPLPVVPSVAAAVSDPSPSTPTPALAIPAPSPRLSLDGLPYIGEVVADGTGLGDGRTGQAAGAGAGSAAPVPVLAEDIEFNLVPTVRTSPIYPPRALRERIEGVVTVEFTIEPDGSVQDPSIVHTSVLKVFDEAVLAAVRQWRFKPKFVAGRAAARRARQDVHFRLQERD